MKKKLVYVVGTRPEFIRSAFIINRLKQDPEIDFKLVHTGQHYSYSLDKIFFAELGLPTPDINLEVKSGTHATQTAEIMTKFERFLLGFKPHLVAVFGDTNSTLATALAAVKLKIPLAHLEAGCREWEMDMPEEINRIMVDHISKLLLPVSRLSMKNLQAERVRGDIIQIGDPLYEVFQFYSRRTLEKVNLPYLLFTLHRDKNTNNLNRLENILTIINEVSPFEVIYPAHPRTMGLLKNKRVNLKKYNQIRFIEPVGYNKIISLIRNSEIVVTDSGGLQKEAFWSKKICVTLRENTAWEETVTMGVNFVTGNELNNINPIISKVLKDKSELEKKFVKLKNPYYKKNNLQLIINSLKAHAQRI